MAIATTQSIRLRQCRLMLLAFFLLLTVGLKSSAAQGESANAESLESLRWSTDSTGPRRFISVHGRRAAIFGYPQGSQSDYFADGLEMWVYPVQIFRSYHVTFRSEGTTTGIDGQTILRRIISSPEAVTRVYAGPDFIVREKLFVPLEEPGAIISYDVEGARSIDIEIRFIPVLDAMWPASIGGQETIWNAGASAYLLREPTHRFSATVGSPDIVAHDETPNIGQQASNLPGLAFTIRAGPGHKTARVIIAGSSAGENVSATAKTLLDTDDALQKAAVKHYEDVLSHSLRIETPDAETNRALAWAEIALDQAWVCNPDLGCGLIAGYGPSRKARRPQYDWFFAGDGMVATQALLAAGEYERARQELEFVIKYQDSNSGMIWHELSQSAGLLDWHKYPYMFGHVNLTFELLDTVGNYLARTGDREFVKEHWNSLQSAYDYCRTLIDANDGLPRIPSDKQGGWEQDPLTDELTLSISWVKAAQAFADLASATGHQDLARPPVQASERALRSIYNRYWDKEQQVWIAGYTRSGQQLMGHGIGPIEVSGQRLISDAEIDAFLNRLSSADFQTDWGTRGSAASAASYDPNSYSRGSVWATSTAHTAREFWSEHRPATAWPIWNALVPWSSLDSLGHMHEVLAGNFYHEELESVPEQTWSSATFLDTAISGLLGLEIDGVASQLTFSPHVPANWEWLDVSGIRIGASTMSVKMTQSEDAIHLQLENAGAPVKVIFDPEIPLGTKLGKARLGEQSLVVSFEQHQQDAHARVQFTLPHGESSLTIGYTGGIRLISDPPQLRIGDASKAIKITGVKLTENRYTVVFEARPSLRQSFEFRSTWPVKSVQGGSKTRVLSDLYRITVQPGISGQSEEYKHGEVVVTFGGKSN